MDEQPRPDANGDEQAYTLTVEEAAALYEAAGHARTMRAIQKYRFRGDLTAIREQRTYGERYRITPASVARHIEQIEQLSQAHRREQPRPDASVRIEEADHVSQKNDGASVREQPRPDATNNRYVAEHEYGAARTRRLAAILAADVAGYSRLMGADEEGMLAALQAIRREPGDP